MQSQALSPSTQLGQYQLMRRIGGGGMGDVYEAMHTRLQKRVAIKTLRQQLTDDQVVVARFVREGQLASQLRHPHIVDVTDAGIIDGFPCLVMELLEGEPLSALMKREGALPVARAVDLLLPIIAALDFAHSRGVLHRDLKPSNVFVTHGWNGDEIPKVLDFGISKLMGEADAHLTTDSMFVGTPLYASPEMMRSERNIDARSDQYALGVILYQCVTGTRPFGADGANALQLAMQVCEGRFVPPRALRPDLPEAFEATILHTMALSPDHRYPSMRALGEALLPFASERARTIWTPTMMGTTSGRVPALVSGPYERVPTSQPGSRRSAPPTPVSSHGSAAPFRITGSGPPMHVSQMAPPLVASTAPGMAHTPPGRSGSATMYVVLALLLVGISATGVGVYYVRASHDVPSTTTPPPAPTTGGARLELSTQPPSASVELDGVPIGTGHVDRTLPDDVAEHRIRISAEGYEPCQLTFTSKLPPGGTITLKRASATPTADAPRTATPQHGGPKFVPPKPGGSAQSGSGGGGGSDGTPTDNLNPWKQ